MNVDNESKYNKDNLYLYFQMELLHLFVDYRALFSQYCVFPILAIRNQ